MTTTYKTVVIGSGNHASLEIPEKNLNEIKGNRRAPLKVTINNYTYQSTATGVAGKCMVVFPMRDRDAAGAKIGDIITVTLELDSGYREVEIPLPLADALKSSGLDREFHDLTYSRRKEYCRSVTEARSLPTIYKRIQNIIAALSPKR